MNLPHPKNTLHPHLFRRLNLSSQKIFWGTAFLILCVIACFLLWMPVSSVAQRSTTFSGRLIDTEGNPIPGIKDLYAAV